MGQFSLENKASVGNLNVSKYLKGGCKESGARHCSVRPSDRIKGDGQH